MGTLLGNVEGAPLPETLRERHIKRDLKMPCKPVSFSVWAPLGNLEGFACWDFWVKRIVLLGSFLDTEDIKILNLKAVWVFGKGTGLSWVDIRLWGTKGLSIKSRCIRNARSQTQFISVNLPLWQNQTTTLKDAVYRDQYVATVIHNFSGESCTSVSIGD